MNQLRPNNRRSIATQPSARRMAFTLIELLVVIAIISLVMAMAFPAIAVMARLTRGGAAKTTIGVAVRAASAYAGKPKRTLSNNLTATPTELTSNGAAILFTPNGDMRILQTDLHAFDTATPSVILQDKSSGTQRFGYSDVPKRDYINLPTNAYVVGVLRDNGNVRLITPPFAVHFDQFGQATTGYKDGGSLGLPDASQMVYYDGNYDGKYNITQNISTRRNNYDPEAWDTKSSTWDPTDTTKYDAQMQRPKLPFEAIETVVGVITFQIDDFRSGDGTPLDLKTEAGQWYLNDNATNWLLDKDTDGKLKNAKQLFFSRNSGTILKEYR